MSYLPDQKCSACRKGAPVVSPAEIAELLPQLHGDWKIIEEQAVPRLVRVFELKDWAQALDFAVQVGDLAEEAGHHPAILVEWGRATVSWWTHAILNLHRNDFIMAAKTDRLFQQLAAQGTQKPLSEAADH